MPEGVSNVQIIELGVFVPCPYCGGQVVIAGVEESQVVGDGCTVALVGAAIRGPTLHREVGFQRWNVDLFVVASRIDEESLWGRRVQ